jgi:enoyl-CoA hydratase/carnithine racemase
LDYQNILVENSEGIGMITLNRPGQLNAMNLAMSLEIDRAVTRFEEDDEVRVLIVTGAGNKAFSAGGDIKEMTGQSKTQLKERSSGRAERFWHLATCKKPTIGAINGLAYGGASVLTTLFDIRIGCENTKFRFLMVSRGRAGATWTLPLIVGWPLAKELLLSGREVKADEALRIGLLNRLVTASELLPTAMELAKDIAANDPETVQAIKKMLDEGIGLSWREKMENEARIRTESVHSPPPKEAFRDFLEKKGG